MTEYETGHWQIWVDDGDGELAMSKVNGSAARDILVVEEMVFEKALNEIESLRKELADKTAALEKAKEALAHDDCYATGPMTGDPVQDLFVCPGCVGIESIKSVLTKYASKETKDE